MHILEDVYDGLIPLARSSTEVALLREVVDLDFIKQQAQAGLYNWESSTKLVATIVHVIERSQAPKRIDETKAKWTVVEQAMRDAQVDPQAQPSAFCNALEFLQGRVNAMRIDEGNMRLRRIVHNIQAHGVEYEQGKFQARLLRGSTTLARTEAWIRAITRTEVQGSKTVDLTALLEGKAAAFVTVHTAAILQLADMGDTPAPARLRVDIAPETLSMDVHHLVRIAREFRLLTTATIMLVSASHVLRNPARETRMAEEIFVPMTPNAPYVDIEATLAAIGEHLDSEPKAIKDTVMQRLRATVSPNDPVHRLM
jgi:hypothetical protein